MLNSGEPCGGTLYICGTPIGNLGDVTQRLLEVLREVDFVACEDTRRTLKILSHFGIKKPLLAVHEYVERERAETVMKALSEGKSVAFVSDAGMPAISDPGAYLVRTARERGFRLVLVPGPSSVTGALSLSGFQADRFVFAGFPPRKSKERREFFREWVRPGVPAVFFEAPHRLKKSLSDLLEVFPSNMEVCLCHEMTKIHESVIFGTIQEVFESIKEAQVHGEWVIVARLDPFPFRGPMTKSEETPIT
ncbi:MAG: 16S rRNA (cytidine(1402)-2'-O)-methyltransferase [Candidatus Fermentithermobacillus carboniphilus]|uniref:Ribosomal RNA small subunit methyltransferase I n=1 Tax=Candidatus Fermentithermobacillus carboniphilus TaxID=3085328 RepID=A0AAT9LD44_9FIRM|nr:MAG: 16S rRNA (cytidine(1402)-2'-O)-methyltransferase [Candidatus Fermentithermobacillus carboniphilus]